MTDLSIHLATFAGDLKSDAQIVRSLAARQRTRVASALNLVEEYGNGLAEAIRKAWPGSTVDVEPFERSGHFVCMQLNFAKRGSSSPKNIFFAVSSDRQGTGFSVLVGRPRYCGNEEKRIRFETDQPTLAGLKPITDAAEAWVKDALADH